MKRIVTALALCVLALGLLSLVSLRVKQQAPLIGVAGSADEKPNEPVLTREPQTLDPIRRHARAALASGSRESELARKIRENMTEEEKAIEDALARGDYEEFYRLGMAMASKEPWELEPEPRLKRFREKMGWTNPPVFIDLPPRKVTQEELEKIRKDIRDWQKSIPGAENSTPFDYRRKGLEPQSSPSDDAVRELNQHLERIEDRERARRTGADKWGTIRVRP